MTVWKYILILIKNKLCDYKIHVSSLDLFSLSPYWKIVLSKTSCYIDECSNFVLKWLIFALNVVVVPEQILLGSIYRGHSKDLWRQCNGSIKVHFHTQENFPQKEDFVKCDWPTQIFLREKFWNYIFEKFSLNNNFSTSGL